jgi:hypothetical protein
MPVIPPEAYEEFKGLDRSPLVVNARDVDPSGTVAVPDDDLEGEVAIGKVV